MNKITSKDNIDTIIKELEEIVGKENIIKNPDKINFFSSDIFYEPSEKLNLVVSPSTSQQVAKSIKLITENNLAVIPRGGGMS